MREDKILGFTLFLMILMISFIPSSSSIITGLDAASTQPLDHRRIVAFLPYWVISNYNPPQGIVDDIVFFDAPLNSDGTLNTSRISSYYSDISRINASCNCRMFFAVTCFDSATIDNVLAYHVSDLVTSIINVIHNYGFMGVNIDFENIKDTNSKTGQDNTDYLISLLSSLRSHGVNVSIDVAGGMPTVFRDSRINGYVDYVFIMGYDYHWASASTTGPVSPFQSTEFDVDDSLGIADDYYSKDRIVLGLPLYGYDWPATSCQPYSDTSGTATAYRLGYIESHYESQYPVEWDDKGHVPWISYYDSSGNCHQLWYDNVTSLALKIDYTVLNGYGGYGYWALGYEEGMSDESLLWNMTLSRKNRPSIATLTLGYDPATGTYNLSVNNMVNVERLNITIEFNADPGAITVNYTSLGREFENRSRTVNGNKITFILQADKGFPGIGVSGDGVLLSFKTSGDTTVKNISASASSRRLTTTGTVWEEGSINNIVNNTPLPVPETTPYLLLGFLAGLAAYFLIVKRRVANSFQSKGFCRSM